VIISVHFAIDRRSLLAVVGPNYSWWAVQYGRFLPCDAMLSAVYVSSCVCPSACTLCVCVCVSVTFRYCIKTAKHRITQTMPHDRVFKWSLSIIIQIGDNNRTFCRISTDKCLARSLCHSRATCLKHSVYVSLCVCVVGHSASMHYCTSQDLVSRQL